MNNYSYIHYNTILHFVKTIFGNRPHEDSGNATFNNFYTLGTPA